MIVTVIDLLLSVVMYAVFIRCLISFLPVRRDNRFVMLLYKFTEPLMALARRLTNRILAGRHMPVDLSPMLIFLGIFVARHIVRFIF
jgi:YggT family protein